MIERAVRVHRSSRDGNVSYSRAVSLVSHASAYCRMSYVMMTTAR